MNKLIYRSRKMKNRKGFTLIELIVVIVIIGILAALLIPRLVGFTDKADATQAVVWGKEVATAMDSFYAEHSAWPANAAEETEVADMSGVTSGAITFGANGAFTVTYTKGGKTFTAGRTSGDTPVLDTTP